MKYLEILFWRFARHLIKKGYGECEEYEELCPSCRAGKIIEWIDEHCELLRM